MRKEFRVRTFAGKTVGTYSREEDANKAKKGGEYVCEYNIPETPCELAAELDVNFEPIDGFKPYSHEAILQERNQEAFDKLAASLSDVCGQCEEQEQELTRLRASEEEAKESLRGVLLWLAEEDSKVDFGLDTGEADLKAMTAFFSSLKQEIIANAREHGIQIDGYDTSPVKRKGVKK